MKRLLIVVLLAGCAQKAPPQDVRTTVYRFSSSACEPADDLAPKLREALKSRDQWKRYAESLEKLPAAKTPHDPHP